MNRRWEQLVEFPNYEVSDLGEFVNARTDRNVRPSMTQQGHAKVTLTQNGMMATRSAAVLVARAFVEQPEPHFDTPIHLDGELMNCAASNLMWRPRWFAILYHKQFRFEQFHSDTARRVDVDSGEEYESLKEVCMKNGLYYQDVIRSCVQGGFVPITYQEFREI